MYRITRMARKKAYREDLVIEKAMNLFWRNGYEGTSMQMLEKEMGINKFSIYSSFGSKNGVFLESIACYKKKLYTLVNELKATQKGAPRPYPGKIYHATPRPNIRYTPTKMTRQHE